MTKSVLIIDFGSQYTHLIGRKIRELGVYAEIYPPKYLNNVTNILNHSVLILSGGPDSVLNKNSPKIDIPLAQIPIPILGICYGQQVLVQQLGGTVVSSEKSEFGRANIKVVSSCSLTDQVWDEGKKYQVWMSHGDSVVEMPEGFDLVAETEGAAFAVIANEKTKQYGVQFHPEVVHTLDGKKLIHNFVKNILCK